MMYSNDRLYLNRHILTPPAMSIRYNGKTVVKNYKKSVKKTKFLTLMKPKYTHTVIIPKKYIKKKNMDLRKSL